MSVSYPVRPVLRGSFYYADFHLLTTEAVTMSDVDLVVDGVNKRSRDNLTGRIARALSRTSGLVFKVSAHPSDMFQPLSRSDASFLAIGEFVRNIDRYTSEPIAASFIYAKVCLLLLRQHQAERYIDTGARIGTSEARLAVMVKLGLVEYFPTEARLALLETERNDEARLFARHCVERYPDTAFRECYVRSLRSRTTIDFWLRNYVADKVARTI